MMWGMAIDPGALLARSYPLPGGPRVRLRLAHHADAPAMQGLLADHGQSASEVEIAHLVRADPRRRVVLCATAPLNGTETLVGFGALDLEGDVDTLVIDERLAGEGLGALLLEALASRARAVLARVA
jgi:N-acetylglutamate synthase-like GNAT family acetyltransferase